MEKEMWEAYAKQAGGLTFDGKPLPTWDELGKERQACWRAAASVCAYEIERLREDREQLQYALMKVCNSLDDNLPAIITKNIALAALGLPLRGMKKGE